MALSDLIALDRSFIYAEFAIISLMTFSFISQGNSITKCKKIEIQEHKLKTWRYLLYLTVFTTWAISILTFVTPSLSRFFLYLLLPINIHYMLDISIPSWICKRLGYGGTCNCDFYKYTDLYPMLSLGLIGNLVFTFVPFSKLGGYLFFAILIIISLIFYYNLPERKLTPLKYPPSFILTNVDELQQFLMNDPHKRKMITILDAKCDFCAIQVDEINRLRFNDLNGRLKIYDLTYKEKIDPMVPFTLNIDTFEKLPVPTTFIFDAGMVIEQKDGVLMENEIEIILAS